MLEHICDRDAFLSGYGPRSLPRAHAEHRFELGAGRVTYQPGEAIRRIKGGNSNRRGPIA